MMENSEAFVKAQHATIVTLLKENTALKENVEHLKELLLTSVPLINDVQRIIVTPEEALIEKQIGILQLKGMVEELSLEDVKKFDLLNKNKQLISNTSATIVAKSKHLPYSNAELLSLVSRAPKAPNNNEL